MFKTKVREGIVERMVDAYNVICKNLFKKETKLDVFLGLKVKLSTGEYGIIEGMFGQSGKTKIRIAGICCLKLSAQLIIGLQSMVTVNYLFTDTM